LYSEEEVPQSITNPVTFQCFTTKWIYHLELRGHCQRIVKHVPHLFPCVHSHVLQSIKITWPQKMILPREII